MEVKVLLLSQQRLVRESLYKAVSDEEIVFLPPAGQIEEAIASIRQSRPDVILLDLNPSLFGIRVAKELQEACPECRILVLSSHYDRIAAAQLALVGVRGFLSKDIGIAELLWAIRETSAGKAVMCEDGKCISTEPPRNDRHGSLTMREAQVLELIANGYANKQVAAELGISIKTVEKHRQRVMCKLQAHETAGLSWRAFCMGVARGPR